MLREMFSMPPGPTGVQAEGTSEDNAIALPVTQPAWEIFLSQAYGK
jgi:hypothetical protein